MRRFPWQRWDCHSIVISLPFHDTPTQQYSWSTTAWKNIYTSHSSNCCTFYMASVSTYKKGSIFYLREFVGDGCISSLCIILTIRIIYRLFRVLSLSSVWLSSMQSKVLLYHHCSSKHVTMATRRWWISNDDDVIHMVSLLYELFHIETKQRHGQLQIKWICTSFAMK